MTNRILDETIAARSQARELLQSLLDAKSAGEAAVGGRDLYKRVTGQSSLDNSIAATRRTLDAYDRLITQLEREAQAEEPALVETVSAVRARV